MHFQGVFIDYRARSPGQCDRLPLVSWFPARPLRVVGEVHTDGRQVGDTSGFFERGPNIS